MTSLICVDIESLGVNPTFSRIVAIGLWGEKYPEPLILLEQDESILLKKFLKSLNDDDFKFVGYNCKGFDIPFLIIRCLKHGLNVSKLDVDSIDLMLLLSNLSGKEKYKRLTDWAEFFNIKTESDGSGKMTAELWGQNDFEGIKTHLKCDMIRTKEIFERLRKSGVI